MMAPARLALAGAFLLCEGPVTGGPGAGPRRVTATLRPPGSSPQALWWLTGRHPEATLRLP
jgi:hypothetical protein